MTPAAGGTTRLPPSTVGPEPPSGPVLREVLHDLGHGIAALAYLAESAIADPALPARAHRRLELIRQEANRLLRLAEQSMGGAEPIETVDLRPFLRAVVAVAASRTGAAVVLAPGADASVRTYATTLWRAVQNLVDNAVRAAGPRGRVEVSMYRWPDRVAIDVADDGPGLRGGGTEPPAGSGLGLGIVYAAARSCGARLRVHPGATGGTRVRLELPRAGAVADGTGEDRHDTARAGR